MFECYILHKTESHSSSFDNTVINTEVKNKTALFQPFNIYRDDERKSEQAYLPHTPHNLTMLHKINGRVCIKYSKKKLDKEYNLHKIIRQQPQNFKFSEKNMVSEFSGIIQICTLCPKNPYLHSFIKFLTEVKKELHV